MKLIKPPKFKFLCRQCDTNEAEYELHERLSECDTPIGTVQTYGYDAVCKGCGNKLDCHELRLYNSIVMAVTTMGFWRLQNPEGTRKQCRRELGFTKETVEKFWDLSLKHATEYRDPEPESESEEQGK